MVSDVFPYGCHQLLRVFNGTANWNKFYSEYPIFNDIDSIWRYLQIHPSVSTWLRKSAAISSYAVKYYMGTSLKTDTFSKQSKKNSAFNWQIVVFISGRMEEINDKFCTMGTVQEIWGEMACVTWLFWTHNPA